jgi:L-threonylcarbamoyladenylate synthase
MRERPDYHHLPEAEFQKCIEVLRSGGTILYPTDTVWGIGCDATNQVAVEKVFAIKGRPDSKSLIVLLREESLLNKYVHEVPAVAWDLLEFSDKPLTIIYDRVGGMAPGVIATDGSCGIRVCKEAFCNRLLHKFGRPLVSTSANKSGEPTPLNFRQISDEIKDAVDYVVNWRQDDFTESQPSSIMKIKENGEFTMIRK